MIRQDRNTEVPAPIARRIAREVANELLIRVGVDCDNPEDVKGLQADFAYLRKARIGSEELVRILKRSAITVAIGALAYALWHGVAQLISSSLPR
ncbi:MAG: hypothetical protein RLN70_07555 [Rhodospirillaceae bacterium]